MGCGAARLKRESADGSVEYAIAASPAVKRSDPRLPLTAKQKYAISASWKGIARAMETTGVLMFTKLFEENAELLDLFTRFRELRTKEAQANSVELSDHATKVMNTLDESVRLLDDADTFFEYLHQVGANHRKIRGFDQEYFWRIEKPFLEAVKTTLGDRYTDNMETIYRTTIKLIIEALVAGYQNGAT